MSSRRPFMVGVAGGTASGKSTVCQKIYDGVGQECSKQVTVLSSESFYVPLSDKQMADADAGQYNFDHPDAYDFKLMHKTLSDLKNAKEVSVPVYDFRTHSVLETKKVLKPLDVVIVEGILLFYSPEIRELFDMKLFVDIDPDTRLARRVLRDFNDLGRDLEQCLNQYISLVKPAFEEFCLPTKKYADIIIPHGGDNDKAIRVIVEHVRDILRTPPCSRESTTDVTGEDRRRTPPPRRETSYRPH